MKETINLINLQLHGNERRIENIGFELRDAQAEVDRLTKSIAEMIAESENLKTQLKHLSSL